jgi:hypothetical protein
VRWSSLANGSAARGLVLLLAFTLSCVPLCSPRMCAHNCCASHSGSCGSGIDQSPTPGCTRSTALLLTAFHLDVRVVFTPASARAAVTAPALLATVGLPLHLRSDTRTIAIPAPPLRI